MRILLLVAGAQSALVSQRNISYAALESSGLLPPPWPLPLPNASSASSFITTSTCCDYGPYTAAAVANASAVFGLFDVPCLPDSWPVLAEWGYELLNNQHNIFPICGNLTMAAYAAPPASREDALARMQLYWACRASVTRGSAPPSTPLVSEIGHYFLAAQSADAGNAFPVIPGSEIGENINSINLHLAASRGAARPFGAPFLIDLSSWFAGFLADFSAQRFWGPASSPVGGHSPSLHRRAAFAAFMSGAGCYVAEAGAVNYFLAAPDSHSLALSPLGEIGAELHAFTHPASGAPPQALRGIPYAPLALAMSPLAGMGLGFFYQGKAWDVFPLRQEEQRLLAYLQALWPGSLTVQSQIHTPQSEAGYMVAGREAWDAVLLGNHTPATLAAAYRAVVFVGAGRVEEPSMAALLQGFVEAGGAALVAADDVALAVAQGWLSSEFLGLALPPAPAPPPGTPVSSVTDVQTGWVGACAPPCALTLAPYFAAELTTASALLTFAPAAGGAPVLGAAVHAWGSLGGRVITLLAPSAALSAALGITAHLVDRLLLDVLPFSLESNATGDGAGGAGGMQALFNRLPGSWLLTLINNGGVSKQPNASAVVDPAQGRRVTVGVLGGAGGGSVTRVEARDGGAAPVSVVWDASTATCNVDVPAGGLRILQLFMGDA